MALYKYLKKEGTVLPTPRMCGDSSLSGKDIELANKAVKRSLSGDSKPVTLSPRGKYNSYTPEERGRIGKYAAENGATKAAMHFSKLLDDVIAFADTQSPNLNLANI